MIAARPRETLEDRLDALDVPRQPRALIMPGVRLEAGRLVVQLRCPECGRGDWWY